MSTWGPTAIAADGDDGYSQYSGWSNGPPVYFGLDGSVATSAGVRFLNVTIPAGSTISSALITVRPTVTISPSSGISMSIVGDDVDDAAAWSSSSRPTNMTNTTASVAWDPAAWVQDTDYNIDVTAIVAEIVARAGWASGNDIRFGFLNDGSTVLARFYDYATSSTACARLTITYTDGGGGSTIVPVLMAQYRQRRN